MTASLAASVQPLVGAAGREFYLVVLTNTGSRACEIVGFPGVSFLGANGEQIDQPATRSGPSGSPVILGPNQQASAELITTPNLCNGGVVTKSASVRIFPPNQTAALIVPGAVAVCQPTILAFQPGTTPRQ